MDAAARNVPLPAHDLFRYNNFHMGKTTNGRVGLKADRKVQTRVASLARRCNEGKLTPDERAEYETYVMAGEFIAILQAQARILLARRGRTT
jgi:hypothetical protein